MISQEMIFFLGAQAIIIFGAVLTFYTRTQTRLKEIELRLSLVEKHDDDIMRKLEEIITVVTDLRIQLSNKQDRN